MNACKRFYDALNFRKPEGRLPMIEWAPWWKDTLERWRNEGLPGELDMLGTYGYFGLDKVVCIYVSSLGKDCPEAETYGAGILSDLRSYEDIKQYLYTDQKIRSFKEKLLELKPEHDRGDIIIRLWIDGYFWHPRNLFGIEKHLMAFYDHPELMLKINEDLAEYNIRLTDELCSVLVPDMVAFVEDMSYNHGSMISYEYYRKFIMPYYIKVIPTLKKYDMKVFVDSDGNIEDMVPWFLEAGIEGILPLERQAGVDLVKLRSKYPKLLLMGGYDKMVMSKGEAEMRKEFERLLPVMRSGGYIPSVDHQTPPGVSFDNYLIYMKLFREYAEKAVI